MRSFRLPAAVLAVLATLAGADPVSDPNILRALERISASSLRGHVSFLASDLLEGRGTPSRGQDIAAEYIAAQFRRAGVEPIGDDGYFQTANFIRLDPEMRGAMAELRSADRKIAADVERIAIQTTAELSIADARVLKVTADPAVVAKLRPEDVRGQVVAIFVQRAFGADAAKRRAALRTIRQMQPAVLMLAGPASPRRQRERLLAEDQLGEQIPTIGVRDGEFAKAIEEAPDGPLEWKLHAKLPAPARRRVALRNVAALLRGSDAELKGEYAMVTAHYDHVGMKARGEGDLIFNGANDDASGTACLMEIAAAMASMNLRPKRSILFVALFGEELGLFGSEYYGRHPLVPLRSTIADVNLEQMGRTDGRDGPKIASATVTGFDYSEVPALFKHAGDQVGVSVYKDEKRSDSFFDRSDNQSLANLGIPAHTLSVALEYPDYHAVEDEWQKLDYENMAQVTRMVALGLYNVANAETAPRWNENEPKAKDYSAAWRALRGERKR